MLVLNRRIVVCATRATLRCQRSPANCAAGCCGPPPVAARPPCAPQGAGLPERVEARRRLITLSGRSETAIASGRELLARGERDDARLKYFV